MKALSPKQARGALMLADGRRRLDIAKALEIDRWTLWSWEKIPAFADRVSELRAEAERDLQESLRGARQLAIDTLLNEMTDSDNSGSERIKAAEAILGRAGLPEVTRTEIEDAGVPAGTPAERVRRALDRLKLAE